MTPDHKIKPTTALSISPLLSHPRLPADHPRLPADPPRRPHKWKEQPYLNQNVSKVTGHDLAWWPGRGRNSTITAQARQVNPPSFHLNLRPQLQIDIRLETAVVHSHLHLLIAGRYQSYSLVSPPARVLMHPSKVEIFNLFLLPLGASMRLLQQEPGVCAVCLPKLRV